MEDRAGYSHPSAQLDLHGTKLREHWLPLNEPREGNQGTLPAQGHWHPLKLSPGSRALRLPLHPPALQEAPKVTPGEESEIEARILPSFV